MSEFQPIKTAPKEGKPLLLWLAAPYSRHAIGRYVNGGDYRGWNIHGIHDEVLTNGRPKPTHWAPLPEPPTT